MRFYPMFLCSFILLLACDSAPKPSKPTATSKITSKAAKEPQVSKELKTPKTPETPETIKPPTPKTGPGQIFVGIVIKATKKNAKIHKVISADPNMWDDTKKKLAHSMKTTWKTFSSQGQDISALALGNKIKFIVTQEPSEHGDKVSTIELKKGQTLKLSTCDNFSLADTATCDSGCCLISTSNKDNQFGQHNRVDISKVCFDMTKKDAKTFPIKSINMHLDQCSLGNVQQSK